MWFSLSLTSALKLLTNAVVVDVSVVNVVVVVVIVVEAVVDSAASSYLSVTLRETRLT